MKLNASVREVAQSLTQAAHDFDSHMPPKRESFADKLKRAVEERGILLGVLTQKQHRENVEHERARYREPKRRALSVSR